MLFIGKKEREITSTNTHTHTLVTHWTHTGHTGMRTAWTILRHRIRFESLSLHYTLLLLHHNLYSRWCFNMIWYDMIQCMEWNGISLASATASASEFACISTKDWKANQVKSKRIESKSDQIKAKRSEANHNALSVASLSLSVHVLYHYQNDSNQINLNRIELIWFESVIENEN